MTVNDAIRQVSETLEIEEFVVRRAYYSVFEFIKETAIELPLKEEYLSREEFEEMKKVFYIPGLGKVNAPYYKYKGIWDAYLKKRKK